jgi:superfamily II DNA/RNA helicase
MLFSATQTRKIEDLARVSLKKEPLYVGVDDVKEKATVDGLEQVCICLCVHIIDGLEQVCMAVCP